MIRPLLIVLLSLSASVTNAQQSSEPSAAPLLAELPDGRQLALYCLGTGSPTVLFDSGLGADARAWSRVQPEIAKTARACAFDRPGYGASDEGPTPRDATHIVSDLRAGLQAAGIAGPYVLVGHSMGGYDMRLFANLHLNEIVGMVLVDPSIDGNEAPLRAVSPAFAQSMAEFHATAGKCIRAAATGQMTPGHPIYAACGSPPLGSPYDERRAGPDGAVRTAEHGRQLPPGSGERTYIQRAAADRTDGGRPEWPRNGHARSRADSLVGGDPRKPRRHRRAVFRRATQGGGRRASHDPNGSA